jgi:hypothetical protein
MATNDHGSTALMSSFADMIDDYRGAVDTQFAKKSIMKGFYPVKSIVGTDTLIQRRVGRTTLQTLTDGVRPNPTRTHFGTVAVSVSVILLARNERPMLNEIQTDFDARSELGKDHGKELAKKFDESLLIMGRRAAQDDLTLAGSVPGTNNGLVPGTPAPTANGGNSYNGAFGAGKQYNLTALADSLDGADIYAGFEAIITAMEEEDIDTDEHVIFVRPAQYSALLNDMAAQLLDKDLSTDNGDFADGVVKTLLGVPIVKTARIPNAVEASHELGSDFNTTAAEARCAGLILHPKSILVGESIPMQSKIWFNDEEKSWFIDSWMAFGAAVDRSDVSGAIFYPAS